MITFSMSKINIGQSYSASELAGIWGYKSFHAIARGIVTPRGFNKIILFVTQTKASDRVQYKDKIDGSILYMAGQLKHQTDDRLINNLKNHKDEFHLFYRERKGEKFTYYGECTLINAKLNEESPSEFEFLIRESEEGFEDEESLIDYLSNLPRGEQGNTNFLLEGAKIIAQHIRYERNPKNREDAIKTQGTVCRICGFDYNKAYGAELANSYIEVHHIKQLSEGKQRVDPARDLIPVCANCHRMLHRKKYNNITVEALKKLVDDCRKNSNQS